jgi:branched-chain amino acid transport system permease protein
MSGYVSGIVAILCINLIFAYAIFATAAAGQLNLGGAGFQAIGAYAAAFLSANLFQPMSVTIPAAMALGALVGFLISFPVLRTRGVYMVLATYAFGEVVAGYFLKSTIFGGATGIVVPDHLGVTALIVAASVVTVLMFLMMATRFGLAMRAIHDDEPVATIMGVNVRATQVACFTIGGGLSGLAGALYAHHFSYVEAQYFNSLLSIYVLLFVLIGGTQTAWGPLVGTLFFTVLPEVMRVGGSWRFVAFGLAIVVMMAVRPQGIVTRALVARIAATLRRPFRPAAAGVRHAG